MSSARNHAKRSHRSEQFKRQTFGSMSRKAYVRTNSYVHKRSALATFFSNLLNRRKKPQVAQAAKNKNIERMNDHE